MNIIYDHQIFTNQSNGGPSRYFTELIKEISILNNNPLIIAPFHKNFYLRKISHLNKKEFSANLRKNLIINLLNNLISNHYFKNLKYDLYHLTYYNNCFKTSKPKVITVYDLIHEKYDKEYKFKNLPKKKIFKNIDHFLCISNNTKKDLINFYNIDENKITVTYLANSIKHKFENLSEYKKNSKVFKKPFFLYVGSRKRYKNFKLFAKSYSHLEKIKNNFDIICFGGGKFLSEELNYMKNLSINLSNIHQLSGSDDLLTNLYLNAEALIYPSRYEGFGLPILEAMSLGCPVISSNSSSLPEVYGDAAINFSPNSEEDLMNCIMKLTFDSDLKSNFVRKGYLREKKFSWKKCAEQTNFVYKKVT